MPSKSPSYDELTSRRGSASQSSAFLLQEWAGNLFTPVDRADDDEEGSAGDSKTERPGRFVSVFICYEEGNAVSHLVAKFSTKGTI